MQKVDWDDLWKKSYEERKKIEYRDPGIEYWDKRAKDFSESRKTNDYEYGRTVIKALHQILNYNSEVLDIGAGPGTFVIPFAKNVKKVTAVEPSKEMAEKIRKNAQEEGVKNFEIISKVWQEVEISGLAPKYDLVISSIVLWMFEDVWEQLKRMERASKGYCCITAGTGEGNGEEQKLWHKIMGDIKKPVYSEYSLIYINKNKLKNALLSHLNPDKDCTILDFGTGTGFLATILAESGYKRIIGLDINEHMLLQAKKKLSGCPAMLVRGDGLSLPLKDNSVDVVVSRWVLWVMPDPERAVKEMIRVTKPGGKIITFESSNYGNKEERLTSKKLLNQLHSIYITLLTGASFVRTKKFWEKTKGKLPMYSLDKYVQIFEQQGLKDVERTEEEEYGTVFAKVFNYEFKYSLIKGTKPNILSHVSDFKTKEWGENEFLRILICPKCHYSIKRIGENDLACEGCNRTFPITEEMPDLLPSEDKLL